MPAEITDPQTPAQTDAPAAILQILDNGTYQLVPHAATPLELATMQSLVDGMIERVCTPRFDLWLNEEGLLRNFEVNIGASWLLAKNGAPGYTIVGPAFIARSDDEGECYPADPDVTQAAVALLQTLGYEPVEERPPIAGGSIHAVDTPWGPAQTNDELAPGVRHVTTAGHGGLMLDDKRWHELPEAARLAFTRLHPKGWAEEDCEMPIALVLLGLEHHSVFGGQDSKVREAAVSTAEYFDDYRPLLPLIEAAQPIDPRTGRRRPA